MVDLTRRMVALSGASVPLAATGALASSTKAFELELFSQIPDREIPDDIALIKTSGHHKSGVGGASYLQSSEATSSAFRAKSKNGLWFELFEPNPDVLMFGAEANYGLGDTDDADSFQAGLDYVRNNAAYSAGPGQGLGHRFCSRLRVPAGQYLVKRSLDFTTDGQLKGLSVCGDGLLQSVIVGDLTEPFPVLDASGMSRFELRDLQIRITSGSAATCGLLTAEPYGSTFHNRFPSVDSCLIEHDPPASQHYVGGWIIHNSDGAAMRNGAEISGVHCGTALPSLHVGPVVSAGSQSLTIAESLPGELLVGKSVTVIAGPALGKTRRIVGHDGRGRLNLEAAWASVPTNTGVKEGYREDGRSAPGPDSIIEIYAVCSKFRLIPRTNSDQTYYSFTGSQIGGLTVRGAEQVILDGCYVVAASPQTVSEKCAILISPVLGAFYGLGDTLITGAFYTESQTAGENSFCAIKSYHPHTQLFHRGILNVDPPDGGGCREGAIISGAATVFGWPHPQNRGALRATFSEAALSDFADTGLYRVEMVDERDFRVENPYRKDLGKGRLGLAFAEEIGFTLSGAGRKGDIFTIFVSRGGFDAIELHSTTQSRTCPLFRLPHVLQSLQGSMRVSAGPGLVRRIEEARFTVITFPHEKASSQKLWSEVLSGHEPV